MARRWTRTLAILTRSSLLCDKTAEIQTRATSCGNKSPTLKNKQNKTFTDLIHSLNVLMGKQNKTKQQVVTSARISQTRPLCLS